MNTLKRTKQDWLRIIGSMFFTSARLNWHPDLPDVPTNVELGNTPEARQILAFYTSSAAVGRSIVAPPGMPTDRVKVLRTAFDAMVKDPEFLAEIERAQQEFQPASGEELQKSSGYGQRTAEIVERTGAIFAPSDIE
jgi:tripartite-type tricarboxylate transporter receptor subunit TctC